MDSSKDSSSVDYRTTISNDPNSISIQIDSQLTNHRQQQSPTDADDPHNPKSRSRLTTPEAHEVKSVRKKVEGMGVEPDHSANPQQSPVKTPPATSNPITIDAPTSTDLPSRPPLQRSNSHPDQTSHPAQLAPDTRSKEIPASWDAYADLHSPFACFAPKSTASILSLSNPLPNPIHTLSNDPPLARAFATPPQNSSTPKTTFPPAFSSFSYTTSGSNSLCPNKFPSGSDFFLKGKRNTPLADSSPDADSDSASQHKKLKLPPSVSSNTIPAFSPSPSSSSQTTQGFASYSAGPSTSLRSSALEQLNSTPSLQILSTTMSPLLQAHPPSSITSSVCAVNGEADDYPSPAPFSTSSIGMSKHSSSNSKNNSSSLGFSAFADSGGFRESTKSAATIDWSGGGVSSVFQPGPGPESSSKDSIGFGTRNTDDQGDLWASGTAQVVGNSKKKTHLALSAELSQEDKHEGFLATEVITGEENEELVKSVRCKMFTLGEDGSWRERGTGGLRLLRTKEEPYRYRLIMRADAVLRVLLNVPIFKGFSYRPTQDKFLTFASPTNGTINNNSGIHQEDESGNSSKESFKPQFQQYLCRFGKPEIRKDMIESIEECLKYLHEGENQTRSQAENEVDAENDCSRATLTPSASQKQMTQQEPVKTDRESPINQSNSSYQNHANDDHVNNVDESVDPSDLV